jgi:Protein of unknown function (DUF3795)
MEKMYDMTAYCGLDCRECQAFKATQANDLQLKKQIAERWSSQGDIKFEPEDIDCLGCKSDVISGWCRKLCKLRPCATDKKVATCAQCDEYQCEKLKEFLRNEPVAAGNLEKIRRTVQP